VGFFKRRSRAERDQGTEIKILVPYEGWPASIPPGVALLARDRTVELARPWGLVR
jgi:hypothetical protein